LIFMRRTKKQIVSYKMSRVKAKGTSLEKLFAKALHIAGLRGYRKNFRGIVGTPDFCWKNKKVAVFCDSAFWHGYNWRVEKKKIKVRKAFWFEKIEANIARDQRVTKKLRDENWMVFRYWDFQIKKDAIACAQKIARALVRS